MFEALPPELTAQHTTPEIDGPILLFEGEMEVVQNGNTWPGKGIIRFEWLPFSRVALILESSPWSKLLEFKPSKVRIPALNTEAELAITRLQPGSDALRVEGRLAAVDSVNVGSPITTYKRVRFHLPNLPQWLGDAVRTSSSGFALKRFVFHHVEWEIVIDAIVFEHDVYQMLANSGGHLLTHVGTVYRRDASSFSLPDCEAILECLSYFLSFCRGAWVFPLLYSCEDESGAAVSTQWRSRLVDRYKRTHSWVPSSEPVAVDLESAFEGYARLWFSPVWADALKTITEWYVESSTGAVEKSIILIQTGLELLAWVVLVEDRRVLTARQWNDKTNPFSKKLRMLLSYSSLDLAIPSGLSDLNTHCVTCNLKDGPEVLTHIRNSLVHPNPKRRAALDLGTLMDAWFLGSWYLDICILNACGYSGTYSNRTVRGVWTGEEVQRVPWV